MEVGIGATLRRVGIIALHLDLGIAASTTRTTRNGQVDLVGISHPVVEEGGHMAAISK